MKIAITGGIGTGKSTVIRYLKDEMKDYIFYSVDDAVGEVYDDDRVKDFMRALGISTRKEMSDIFFMEPLIKERFEKIANPLIQEKIDNWLTLENVIVEFPLLFERGDRTKFDYVVSVTASEDARVKRVMIRSGFSESKVRSIIAQQMDQKQRDEMADMVFDNTEDSGSLQDVIGFLAKSLRANSAQKKKAKNVLDQLKNPNHPAKIRSNLVVGIISGSFDPITRGHLHVIKKALKMVDELRIVVSPSYKKGPGVFTLDERISLIKDAILCIDSKDLTYEDINRIHYDILSRETALIDHARAKSASFIFRGLRGVTDLEYERTINSVQRDIDPDIETVYFMPPDDLTKVSSSLIKELVSLNVTDVAIQKYVTASVLEALKSKRETLV